MNKTRHAKVTILVSIFIFFSSIILANNACADDCLKKLGRGVSNIALCFVELPMGIESTGKESGVAAAVSHGILKGLGRSVLRLVCGVYETATFLVPLPKAYKPILTNPEFIFGKDITVEK